MADALILEFQGVTKSQYDAVNQKLGIDPGSGQGDWPKGMRSHVGGTSEGGGFMVVEVWDDMGAQDEFMRTRLGPALGEVGLPEPSRMAWFQVIGYHTP
jgi:hypothetical protein